MALSYLLHNAVMKEKLDLLKKKKKTRSPAYLLFNHNHIYDPIKLLANYYIWEK